MMKNSDKVLGFIYVHETLLKCHTFCCCYIYSITYSVRQGVAIMLTVTTIANRARSRGTGCIPFTINMMHITKSI